MRMRITVLILALLTGMHANAQTKQLSAPMNAYKDACLKMQEGIAQGFDSDLLLDAIDMFQKVEIIPFDEADYHASDSVTAKNEAMPKIWYIPEYADKLILTKQLVKLDDISIMRGDFDIQVLHKGIKPYGKISYISAGCDHCEMLVVSEKDSNIRLTVKDTSKDIEYKGVSGKTRNVSWVVWDMPAEGGEFIFSVENLSDKEVSLVIAVN